MSLLDEIAGAVGKPFTKHIASRARLPKLDGNIYIDNIGENIDIIRDEWGIPHVYANTISDAIFAQGFVHAQDRLWQMELNRKAARGKLSEFLGKDALDSDRVARTLGYERIAKQDWDLLSEEVQNLIKRYCDGINAFIHHKESKLPVEFAILKHQPEDWHPIDVASFGRMLISLMTFGWYDEIMRAKLIAKIGVEAAEEIDNPYPKYNPVTLPNDIEINAFTVDGKFRALDGAFFPRINGSNAWSVHGSLTKTGKPFLCNDPHLTLKNPNIWYQMHIVSESEDFNVTGVSVPALPSILIGHNQHIAWGITLSYTDLEDIYIEKFTDDSLLHYEYDGAIKDTIIYEEKIQIKDQKIPHVEKVYATDRGVIVSDITNHNHQQLSLCSMAFRPGLSFQGWFDLDRAKNWDDFKTAVKCITAPGLNIVYADKEENIGYYNSGKVPIRDKQFAAVPQDGSLKENQWKEFVPFEKMPHALNPSKGYIITANNKIQSNEYEYFLGDIYMNGYRANRLTKMMDSKNKVGIADFTEMQMDWFCTPTVQYKSYFKDIIMPNAELQQLLDKLLAWNGVLDPNEIEGSLYKVSKQMIVKRMYRNMIQDKELIREYLGHGFHAIYAPINAFIGHNTTALFRVLDNPNSVWLAASGGKEKLLIDGFKDAVDWLKINYGTDLKKWNWGRLHAIVFPHAFTVVPALKKIFDVGPYEIGGDTDTPFQTFTINDEGFGGELGSASYRQIIDFSDFDNSKIIMPLGNSGNMASPYYKNQLRKWFKGEFIPMCFTRNKVEQHKQHELILKKA
ncbi:MAG: penicillin acylase family protein [Chitinophagales bacterium]|nr:penicillin acylase family protein [Chitinophagales bacterium]